MEGWREEDTNKWIGNTLRSGTLCKLGKLESPVLAKQSSFARTARSVKGRVGEIQIQDRGGDARKQDERCEDHVAGD